MNQELFDRCVETLLLLNKRGDKIIYHIIPIDKKRKLTISFIQEVDDYEFWHSCVSFSRCVRSGIYVYLDLHLYQEPTCMYFESPSINRRNAYDFCSAFTYYQEIQNITKTSAYDFLDKNKDKFIETIEDLKILLI